MLKSILIASTLVCMSGVTAHIAVAQDEAIQERVVVTGSRISRDTQIGSNKPYITQKVRADFMVLSFDFVSGSLDRLERRQELETMFERVKSAVGEAPGFSLEGGDISERYPIETTMFDDLFSSNYGSFSSISLVLKVDVKENELFDTARERGEAFVEAIELAGRAQSRFDEEQYIGVRDIGRHRDSLLKAIDDDCKKLKRIFGADKVEVTGLESEIVSIPVGALTMELFIPYTISITR